MTVADLMDALAAYGLGRPVKVVSVFGDDVLDVGAVTDRGGYIAISHAPLPPTCRKCERIMAGEESHECRP